MIDEQYIERALAQIQKRAANHDYFFARLSSPDWIGPLRDKGLFSSPPGAIRRADTISFPRWPESQYLARMAAKAPKLVTETLLAIPPTDNVIVHEDFIDAALDMPPTFAAEVAKHELPWIEKQTNLFGLLPEKLGKLTFLLAEEPQQAVTLRLIESLLRPLPDKSERDGEMGALRYPSARFDLWNYQRFLEATASPLAMKLGEPYLDLLVRLCSQAIILSLPEEEREPPEDLSWLWRPSIADHSQNMDSDVRDPLVAAVRDAALNIVEGRGATVSHMVGMLEGHKWWTFRRIAFHILSVCDPCPIDLLEGRLANEDMFRCVPMHHEYWELARAKLGSVSAAVRDTVLAWIDAGPDLEGFAARHKEHAGEEPTDSERNRYREIWQRDRLSMISEHLPNEWSRRFDELRRKYGETEHADFLSWVSVGSVGPSSLKSTEELAEMTDEQVLQFLKKWEPSGDWGDSEPEGLGRRLSEMISEDPVPLAEVALGFRALRPVHTSNLLGGLEQALRKERGFDWKPVLELCQWAVEHHDAASNDSDGRWSWVRRSEVELVGQGCQQGPGSLPLSERGRVWRIIESLTNDPEPTREHEAKYGGDNMDPPTLALNTIRGRAMEAVVRYALWVKRELSSDGPFSFDVVPECRNVLEHRLDPAVEPSAAIRSVYGQWFPWLVLIDEDWCHKHRASIFPPQNENRPLYEAAWYAYLTFCDAYDSCLLILEGEYRRTLDELSSPPSQKPRDPHECFAEHLMKFYWRGKLQLDDATSLLSEFFAKAPDKLRGHAIEFIGRSLRNTEGELEAKYQIRLKALWESRVASASKTPSAHSEEFLAFGWWFASQKFDDSWIIPQLVVAAETVKRLEPAHMVLEVLVPKAARWPADALRCVSAMAAGDNTPWGVYMWRDDVSAVIAAVLEHGDASAQENARKLVHWLGAKGHREFRDLLRVNEPPTPST